MVGSAFNIHTPLAPLYIDQGTVHATYTNVREEVRSFEFPNASSLEHLQKLMRWQQRTWVLS